MTGKYFDSAEGTTRRDFIKGIGILGLGLTPLACVPLDKDYKGSWREVNYEGGKKPWNYASEIAEKSCEDAGFFEKYKCDPRYWLDQIKRENPGLDYGKMIPGETKFMVPDID